MDRDSKGRFSKKAEEGFKIIFDIPSIKRILIWVVLFGILLPWISIIAKFEILNKLLSLFDELMEEKSMKMIIQRKVVYLVKNY